jgi:hypothetical protein
MVFSNGTATSAGGARKRRLRRRRINAPTNLTATATSDSTIALSWTETIPQPGQYVDGYRLFRNGVEIHNIQLPVFPPHHATSYNDTSLEAGTTYTYELYAYNRFGGQSPSATTTATTLEEEE